MVMDWWRRRQTPRDEVDLQRAIAMVDDAVRLSIAERRDEAVEAGERALATVRELVRHDSEQVLPVLVLALCNQSRYLANAGRLSAGLEVAEEAVDRAYDLHTVDRGHARSLAQALVTVANRLVEAGRPQEALARSHAATELSGVRPDAVLARQTATLALSLAAIGRHADALRSGEEALRMWRDLAAEEPVDHEARTEYGRSLHNHTNRLYAVGRWEDAVLAGAESVAWYRTTADEDGTSRQVKLAQALGNYAICLAKVGRDDDALQATAEAVPISRELVQIHPAHRARLASALHGHGARLAVLGRSAAGRAAMAESLQLYRDLAVTDRRAYRSRLAETVSDLAAISDSGDGLALAEEAVTLRRELAADNPGVELPGLALSLSNLAGKQDRARRLDTALVTGDEALRVVRQALVSDRAAVTPRYAVLLLDQAARLDQAGRAADAVALGTEAVAVTREALAGHRTAHLSLLSDALRAQARRLQSASNRSKNMTRLARAMIAEADVLSAEQEACRGR